MPLAVSSNSGSRDAALGATRFPGAFQLLQLRERGFGIDPTAGPWRGYADQTDCERGQQLTCRHVVSFRCLVRSVRVKDERGVAEFDTLFGYGFLRIYADSRGWHPDSLRLFPAGRGALRALGRLERARIQAGSLDFCNAGLYLRSSSRPGRRQNTAPARRDPQAVATSEVQSAPIRVNPCS